MAISGIGMSASSASFHDSANITTMTRLTSISVSTPTKMPGPSIIRTAMISFV